MKNLAYEVQLQGEMESRLCYLVKSWGIELDFILLLSKWNLRIEISDQVPIFQWYGGWYHHYSPGLMCCLDFRVVDVAINKSSAIYYNVFVPSNNSKAAIFCWCQQHFQYNPIHWNRYSQFACLKSLPVDECKNLCRAWKNGYIWNLAYILYWFHCEL